MVEEKPRIGRPPGKHSNPDFAQMTLYIDRTIRGLVKAELAKAAITETEGRTGEFSALVEDLLRQWLKERRVKVPSARKVTEGDKR